MNELTRLLELAGIAKGPTIVDATMKNGEINRATATKMIDPKGWFPVKEDGWSRANRHELAVDSAEAFVMDHFTPAEFIESEVFEHDLGGREDPIAPQEILDTLAYYLRDFINRHFMSNGESHEDDLTGVAKALYPHVRDVMESKGIAVAD